MVSINKLHPGLRNPIEKKELYSETVARRFTEKVDENPEPIVDLSNRHVVSAWQFDRDMIVQLSRLAAVYESTPVLFHKPLSGKILISAFYEPSTRTRLSFESAWHRLGGDIMSITDAGTTGIAKGESLEDVAEMFNNYGDVVVLRDNKDDSVYRMLDSLRIPILNAGNGVDEHPTQALADLYTILKWKPELAFRNSAPEDKITLGIIGTPARMRTVRSLLILLSFFSDAINEVVIINPDPDALGREQEKELHEAGLKLRRVSSLNSVLPELDVVYINSIAWVGESFEKLAGDMKLSISSPLKKGSIVLHPLARADELDSSLDDTEHNWYFAQARGAVYMRMALLTCLVQRVNLVMDVSDPTIEEDA
jgi:aspartate carbamoyltransferase catalytic subunit